jgi:hypothetical protein
MSSIVYVLRSIPQEVAKRQARKGERQLWLPTALFRSPPVRYSSAMTTSTPRKYRCMQCEMTEDRCDCEKYCCLCQSLMEVRLCEDGLYYCKPCRDACGYKVSDDGSSSHI